MKIDPADLERLFEEVVAMQQEKLMRHGRRIVPTLTSEDLLQPNDYPELNLDPEFRYEEGVLSGMQSLQTAFRAYSKEVNFN